MPEGQSPEQIEFMSQLEIQLSVAGVGDAYAALREIASIDKELIRDVNTLKKKYGGFDKAIDALIKRYKKRAVAAKAAGDIEQKNIKILLRGYNQLTSEVRGYAKEVTRAATRLIIPASLGNAIGVTLEYNKSLLATAASVNRLGIGIGYMQKSLEGVSKETTLTRQETVKLFDQYQEGMRLVSIRQFAKMMSRIKDIVGADAAAIAKMQKAIVSLSEAYPSLAAGLADMEEGDERILKGKIRNLLLIGKIGAAEYKQLSAFISGNQQRTAAEKKILEQKQAQIKAVNEFKRQWEAASMVLGEQLLPIVEKLAEWLKNIQEYTRDWEITLVKIAAIYAGLKIGGFLLATGGSVVTGAIAGKIAGRVIAGRIAGGAAVTGGGMLLGKTLAGGATAAAPYVFPAGAVTGTTVGTVATGATAVAGTVAGVGIGTIALGATAALIALGSAAVLLSDDFAEAAGNLDIVQKIVSNRANVSDPSKGKFFDIERMSLQTPGFSAAPGLNAAVKKERREKFEAEKIFQERARKTEEKQRELAQKEHKAFLKNRQKIIEAEQEADAKSMQTTGIGSMQTELWKKRDEMKEKIKAAEGNVKLAQTNLETEKGTTQELVLAKAALQDEKDILAVIEARQENIILLMEKQRTLVEKMQGLYQVQGAELDAMITKMSITGDINVDEMMSGMKGVLKTLDETIESRRLYVKFLEMEDPIATKAALKAEKDNENRTKAQRAMFKIWADLQGKGLEDLDVKKAIVEQEAKITDEIKERVGWLKKGKNIMDGTLGLLQAQATHTGLMIQLADNYAIGVAASAKIRRKEYDQQGEIIQMLKVKRAIAQQAYMKDQQNLDLLKDIQEIDNAIAQSAIKQATSVKSMRDGWVSAISAMNTGAGAFTEIIIDAETNTAQVLNLEGAVLSKYSGAKARRDPYGYIIEDVGFMGSERQTHLGGFYGRGGRREGEAPYMTDAERRDGLSREKGAYGAVLEKAQRREVKSMIARMISDSAYAMGGGGIMQAATANKYTFSSAIAASDEFTKGFIGGSNGTTPNATIGVNVNIGVINGIDKIGEIVGEEVEKAVAIAFNGYGAR